MNNSITKVVYTETGHRLMDYKGRCAHLHGHSYRWEVTVAGPVDDRGMIVDFSQLKEVLIETIGEWDHALLLREDDPIVIANKKYAVTSSLFLSTSGLPGRVFVYPWNPTAENMARHMIQVVDELLPTFAPVECFVSKIRLYETRDSFAEVKGAEVKGLLWNTPKDVSDVPTDIRMEYVG